MTISPSLEIEKADRVKLKTNWILEIIIIVIDEEIIIVIKDKSFNKASKINDDKGNIGIVEIVIIFPILINVFNG